MKKQAIAKNPKRTKKLIVKGKRQATVAFPCRPVYSTP